MIGQQLKTPPTSGSEKVETVTSFYKISTYNRVLKVRLKCGIAGRLVNRSVEFYTIMLLVSSCSEELSIQQAAPGFGTFPIQSLACRSVVSVLAHACPVRSNLLAACREMGLIKSLTEINPTPIWGVQRKREITYLKNLKITRTGWHEGLVSVTRGFAVHHYVLAPFCLWDASSVNC